MKVQYFTICSRNYLAYALTLRASIIKVDPEAAVDIVLADAPFDCDVDIKDARCLAVTDIGLPDLHDMAGRYDVTEFNTAIKPFVFQHIFETRDIDAAIYLDPDIYVYAPLKEALGALASGADAVLTPHMRAPIPADGYSPTTADVLRTGVFNLGFAAFRRSVSSSRFFQWWSQRCARDCFVDLPAGLFVDQKFVDAAPALMENLSVLRHPGYNIAYWNLHERPIARSATGALTADQEPFRFFHFSGVAPDDERVVSKYQNRFSAETIGAAVPLFSEYRRRLRNNNHEQYRQIPYAYGSYNDGRAIPHAARRIYARRRDAGEDVRPFNPDYGHMNAAADDLPRTVGAPITRLMHEVWRMRSDLQAAFPLTTPFGRRRFHAWFLTSGQRELGLDAKFVDPARGFGLETAIQAARAAARGMPSAWRGRLVSPSVPESRRHS